LILRLAREGLATSRRDRDPETGEKLVSALSSRNMPGAAASTPRAPCFRPPPTAKRWRLSANGTAISVSLFKSLNFNPVTDFVPVQHGFSTYLRHQGRLAVPDAG